MSESLISDNENCEANGAATVPCTADRVTHVSVVVPLYNETECLPYLIEQVQALQTRQRGRFQFEFIFVDDGSTDATRYHLTKELEDCPTARVIAHDRNRGIAAAIQTGIRAASYETVASIDADGSYDLALLEEMIPLLTEEVDLVTASPYHPAGGVENVPAWRLWISQRASAVYRSLMSQKLHCSTSCFRVYRRSKVAPLPLENEGFVGVAEMAWRMDRQGSKIVEHPAILRTRLAGHSKMKIVRATLRHLLFIGKTIFDRRMVCSNTKARATESLSQTQPTQGTN